MKVSVLIAVIAVFACTASVAFASVPGTTSQTWMFATESGSGSPDLVNNPYGSPTAAITVDENGGGYWDTFDVVYGSAQGWWDIGTGTIVLNIPTPTDAGTGTSEDVVVWVKYWKDISAGPDVELSPIVSPSGVTSTMVEDGPMGGAWWADTWTFQIAPGAGAQTITLSGALGLGSQIDEIRVDTALAAVPEPGGILALCSGLVGFAGFAGRRRRA